MSNPAGSKWNCATENRVRQTHWASAQRLWVVPCAGLAARPPTCLQNCLPQVCAFDNTYALRLPASLKLGTRIHSAQPAAKMWTSLCRPRTPRPASFATRRTGLLWLETYRTIAQCSRAYAGGVFREEESAWQANAEPLAAEAWYLCLFHILIFFFNLRVFIKE